MSMVNPAGLVLRGPVGGFRFDAFDQSLELEEAAHDLRALMIEVNDGLEKHVAELAEALSKEHGVPIEKLMANTVGGLSFFIAFSAGKAS